VSEAVTVTEGVLEAGEILFISRREVEELLTPAACFERCLETFRWVGEGLVDQVNPINLFIHDRDVPEPPFGHGVVQAFPALIRPLGRAAVKWLASFRRNPARGLPSISAVDLLTDIETGMPLAVIDGTSVTNMRTGGHAAVGARFLARPDSRVVAVIGCGNEGRTHLELLNAIFPLEEVRVFDVAPETMDHFSVEMGDRTGLAIRPSRSVEEAVEGADIVCVVTTASEPVLWERSVGPGTHVCATTGFRDVDKACARAFDKWVVGWYGRDLEWIEGPEVGRFGGLEPGDLGKGDIYADLATEIVLERRPGRQGAEERTIMTHMGMPALDAAVASLVYDLAVSNGRGQVLRLF
jgi:ornithine cyclodeaminase/alanine dehydrogenase-like protein (mu-crystallin family)